MKRPREAGTQSTPSNSSAQNVPILIQPTIARALGVPEPRRKRVILKAINAPQHFHKPLVVELFCGIGGWTEGSRQAGFHTILAIDSSVNLLKVHKRNHPESTQCVMVVGPDAENELIELIHAHVPPGREFHLHGSPPCQRISCTSVVRDQRHHDVDGGVSLVTWFVAFVHRLKPTTWSMEEVPHAQVTGALSMARRFFPCLIDFVPILVMSDYGVPQHRKRCIAGTPRLIERLRTDASVREDAPVLSDVVDPPRGATVCMSSTGKQPDYSENVQQPDGTYTNHTIRRCMRSVHEVTWTCLAGHRLIWCKPDYRKVRHFTVREQAAVQTFPAEYRFGAHETTATTGIGNAVPPHFARVFMRGV
jgi:DNA (cytosine-5)-methyltransferase 1